MALNGLITVLIKHSNGPHFWSKNRKRSSILHKCALSQKHTEGLKRRGELLSYE
jgi:hypothetical protein